MFFPQSNPKFLDLILDFAPSSHGVDFTPHRERSSFLNIPIGRLLILGRGSQHVVWTVRIVT